MDTSIEESMIDRPLRQIGCRPDFDSRGSPLRCARSGISPVARVTAAGSSSSLHRRNEAFLMSGASPPRARYSPGGSIDSTSWTVRQSSPEPEAHARVGESTRPASPSGAMPPRLPMPRGARDAKGGGRFVRQTQVRGAHPQPAER